MTAAKPSASFPIKKISFPHHHSTAEHSFVRSHASNSESLRILEHKKEEARLAAREAARRAAFGCHGDLLGETALKKNGGNSKRSKWKNKTKSSLHEEDFSIVGTRSSATAALTSVVEDGTPTKSSRSSSKKPMRKHGNDKSHIDKLSSQMDVYQLAQNLSSLGAHACSICGTIYDSLANATRHEDKCLVRWIQSIEKNRDETEVRKLLEFPAEHNPSALTMRQIPKRGLQRSNAVSTDNPIGHASQPSLSRNNALSSRPKYETSTNGFTPPLTGGEVALTSSDLQSHMLITDEAAVDIIKRSKFVMYSLCLKELGYMNDSPLENVDETKKASLLLKKREFEAQQEIAMLSHNRAYYGLVERQSLEQSFGPLPTYDNPYKYYMHQYARKMGVDTGLSNRRNGNLEKSSLLPRKTWNVIKHRFEHAYELIKEGPASKDGMEHTKKTKIELGSKTIDEIKHGKNTLYVNVVVKNSVQVVNNELQRMARGWWQSETGGEKAQKEKILDFQFEWIRAHTQKRIIQLAAVALGSDFTPRKVAVQLSNDLYRLLGPQLQLRGVTIQTEIEYRSGQYFVLAVNVLHIDWRPLFDHTAKQLARRRKKWLNVRQKRFSVIGSSVTAKEIPKKRRRPFREILLATRSRFPSRNEVVAQFLAFMNRFHFIISLPLINILYYFLFKYIVDFYILTVVTDDIFRYIEKKGMEMQLEIKKNSEQASFMLAALRELREDDKKRKEKEDKDNGGDGTKPILGPLMGPLIKDDSGDVTLPINFDPPAALEFVAFEVDLPIGFLRLRWALLHADSKFWKDAFFVDTMKYDNITDGKWSTNEKEIGLPKAPDGIDENGFLNATLEFSYLMPKSAFVKANTCYATHEIIYYDDHCFVINEKTLTPEVPYGHTFVAWTQYSIVNTGKNTCRMVCSVEAEFPNGPPMVARQIQSGMRSGTSEKFVLLGETICRYAEAVP